MIAWLALLLQISTALQSAPVVGASGSGIVVAADGSEKYARIADAIDDGLQQTGVGEPITIRVKPGIYHERLDVPRGFHRPVHLVGSDPKTTVITCNLDANVLGLDGQKIGTAGTPTVRIRADAFTCDNLTIENAAVPNSGQAVALAISGDRVTFYHCALVGFQDTVYAERGRHYFKDCTIVGAVDFIFGGATEYFENCTIRSVADGFIAASSAPADQPFGLVFDHCHITAEPGVNTFLGRPWRPFAAAAYLNCEMDDVIRRDGWDDWSNVDQEKTTRFAVYQNIGPGAVAAGRLSWIKKLSDDEAAAYQRSNVLAGWNPAINLVEQP